MRRLLLVMGSLHEIRERHAESAGNAVERFDVGGMERRFESSYRHSVDPRFCSQGFLRHAPFLPQLSNPLGYPLRRR
jgi:hypothetical protein